jgi:hypothetical protein
VCRVFTSNGWCSISDLCTTNGMGGAQDRKYLEASTSASLSVVCIIDVIRLSFIVIYNLINQSCDIKILIYFFFQFNTYRRLLLHIYRHKQSRWLPGVRMWCNVLIPQDLQDNLWMGSCWMLMSGLIKCHQSMCHW